MLAKVAQSTVGAWQIGELTSPFRRHPQDQLCVFFSSSLLGVASSFIAALLSSRALLISWELPVPIDLVFDSPHIDWSVPYGGNSTIIPGSFFDDGSLREKRSGTRVQKIRNWNAPRLDERWPGLVEHWGREDGKEWVRVSG